MNYVIDMHDRHKQKRVFHINMLREFHSSSSPGSSSTACWTEEERGVDQHDDIPVWNGAEEDADVEVQMGEQLSEVTCSFSMSFMPLLVTIQEELDWSNTVQRRERHSPSGYHRIGFHRPIWAPLSRRSRK